MTKKRERHQLKQFTPPFLLRNPHIQTVLASRRPRWLLAGSCSSLLSGSSEHILDCGDGVRLLGSFRGPKGPPRGLVILIHGWEGSIDSTYLLSAASLLHSHGFSIFRLNLRDHGTSHHLNRELFNSSRLAEVVSAVRAILQRFPHHHNFLVGFSLGGNFALRIGLVAPSHGIPLDRIVAISPLIDPLATTVHLEKNLYVYHTYFVRKWQRSLHTKLQYFPDLGYEKNLCQRRSLSTMNDYFVPNHTGYATPEAYLDSYAIGRDRLRELTIGSHILTARDDPITLLADLQTIDPVPPSLTIEVYRYGGHCGFLHNLRLPSWADYRLVTLFDSCSNGSL